MITWKTGRGSVGAHANAPTTVQRLADAARSAQEKISTRPGGQQRLAHRARPVPDLDEAGGTVRTVTHASAVTASTVRERARRMAEHGIDWLHDRDRSGRPRSYEDEVARDLLTSATSVPLRPCAGSSHAHPAQAMGQLNRASAPPGSPAPRSLRGRAGCTRHRLAEPA
ncbi:hypothetical protein [Kineococcus sp. SYSU DK018]|uniref:hypothetical protein n=1 Tax=Kineococcus sp. SYSU DK018 TaxID=3383139 RepID=UPI003D7C8517